MLFLDLRRLIATGAAAAVVLLLLWFVVFRSDATSPQPTHSTVVELDVSGSGQALDLQGKFLSVVQTEADRLTAGSSMSVLTLDGAVQASACPPVRADVTLTGNNGSTRNEELSRIRSDLVAATRVRLSCANTAYTPGSDLVGALVSGAQELDRSADVQRIVLVSDGLQETQELGFRPSKLTNPAWRRQTLQTLSEEGLLPRLDHVRLVITDLGAGANGFTAAASAGLRMFWQSYANATGATLTDR